MTGVLSSTIKGIRQSKKLPCSVRAVHLSSSWLSFFWRWGMGTVENEIWNRALLQHIWRWRERVCRTGVRFSTLHTSAVR